MTKAAQIMDLYSAGLKTGEIARIVGCLPSYVRVVARQRQGYGVSYIDIRYKTSPLGQATIKKREPRRLAYERVLRKTSDRDKAIAAARAAQARAKAHGASDREARNVGERARWLVIKQTGNRRLARKAYREASHV